MRLSRNSLCLYHFKAFDSVDRFVYESEKSSQRRVRTASRGNVIINRNVLLRRRKCFRNCVHRAIACHLPIGEGFLRFRGRPLRLIFEPRLVHKHLYSTIILPRNLWELRCITGPAAVCNFSSFEVGAGGHCRDPTMVQC